MTTDPNPAIDGATTALQRQVAELTVELERVKTEHSAEAEKKASMLNTERLEAFAALATERAAREQAEKDIQSLKDTALRAIEAQQRAQGERHTALARVKELKATLAPEVGAAYSRMATKLMAAETALASARELLEAPALSWTYEHWDDWKGRAASWLTSHPSPAPVAAPTDDGDIEGWRELDREMTALAGEPVAAPCAGCENGTCPWLKDYP